MMEMNHRRCCDSIVAAIDELVVALRHTEGALEPRERLIEGVERARRHFEEHLQCSEAPGGLLTSLVAERPQLANRTEHLRQEHATLASSLDEVEDLLGGGANLNDEVCPRVRRLVQLLRQHQDFGMRMLHEAFVVEIGGHG